MNSILHVYTDLSENERRTFLLHTIYSLLDGLILGGFTLNEFVFQKNFHPDLFKISLLFQLGVLVLPFSIFFTQFYEKVANKKRLLARIGLFTRIPLLLFIFFPILPADQLQSDWVQNVFLIVFLLFYFASPFTIPLINHLLKLNYSPDKLGKLYSYSWSINLFTQLISSLLFGWLLDEFPTSFAYVYPVLGVIGLFSIYLISKMKNETEQKYYDDISLFESWGNTLDKSIKILTENKPFRDFQIGMMIYGVAFLMNLGVVAKFLNDQYDLNYSEVAGYKGIALVLAILTFPLFGLILDRKDPRRFGNMSFILCALFFALMVAAFYFHRPIHINSVRIFIFLALAYIAYGFFQSSMTILWGIGSSYFAPNDQVATYQAIHCSLTGIRGLLAPIIGTLLFSMFSFVGAFIASILLLLFAIYYHRKSMAKWKILRGESSQEPANIEL